MRKRIARRPPALVSVATGWLCLVLAMAPLPAHGQSDSKAPGWSQFENQPGMKKLRETMTLGETLNSEQLTFLAESVLPQLEAQVNRPQIDRIVRRKLREAQNWTDNPETLEQYTKAAVDFMARLARDEKKETVVRVNAALLVGDLNDADKKRPWPGALAPLVALASDPALSPEVRIAAAAGLQRHADAARAAGQQPLAGFAEKAAPAIIAMLTPPATMDRAAADWLTARALTMLRTLGPAAPVAAITAATAIFDDAARPVDLRIRSAALIGAAQPRNTEPAKVVAAAESLARDLLQAENAATEAEKDQPPARPGEPAAAAPAARRLAGKRLAWRLHTLANGVFSEDTTAGVALQITDKAAADAAKEFARRLRQAADNLNKNPGEDAVRAALETLGGGQPRPESEPQPAPPEEQPKPPKPPEDDPNNPFK